MKEITFGEKQLIQDQNPFIVSNYRQAKNTGYPKGLFSLIFFFYSLISRSWTRLVNLINLFTLCFLPQSLWGLLATYLIQEFK